MPVSASAFTAIAARENTTSVLDRLARKARDKLAKLERLPADHDLDRKKAAIRAAIERARARASGTDKS